MPSLAYLDGWFAHKQAAENDVNGPSNPFDETTQPVSSAQWSAGYSQRFSARKHGLDMSLDDTETWAAELENH